MKDVMLTTFNNPYDPFTNYEEWYRFDLNNGTDCCGYLARMVDRVESDNKKIAKTEDSFVDDETKDEFIEKALKKIIGMEPLTYTVVERDDPRYKLSAEEFKKTIPNVE